MRNTFGCTCGRRFCNGVDFHARRGAALQLASARRELWRQYRAMTNYKLCRRHALYQYLTTSEQAKSVRPVNIQRVDLWYLRLINTELRNRGIAVD